MATNLPEALTFDDVLITPAYSRVLPRQVDLATSLTRNIRLNIPIVSAAMDTVSEARLAIAIAQEGGLGVIHKNMSIEEQAQQVRKVKKFESGVVKDPICVPPTTTVQELLDITNRNNFSGVPVVDNDNLLGIVTRRDIRFETNLDLPVSEVMTPKERLITVHEHAGQEEILSLLHKHRIEKILIVDDEFHCRGLVTVKDIQKAREKPLACKDDDQCLRVGAAVGTRDSDRERITAIVTAGVDVVVIDTAHGHSQGVIDQLKWIKKHYPQVEVIAGNIATGAAAMDLVNAGADAIKVGIGPGSICTTRIVTGVGVPQITAIMNVKQALAGTGIPIIGDGGLRFSGDVSKAIVAGADSVMIGSLFAGTEESPGEIELFQGRTYKNYRGMGSLSAMSRPNGSSDRYFQDNIQANDKLVPEGIEGRVPYKGPISQVVHQLIGGLRACMGYTGSATITDLQQNAKFVKVTNAGMLESHVHDVNITKQAPNYQIEK